MNLSSFNKRTAITTESL